MSYSIELDNQPAKFLDKLPKNIALRIIDKLEQIKEDPLRFLEHYEGNYYKIRIGDYRALIDLDFQKKIIFIRVFDKRGRVYK